MGSRNDGDDDDDDDDDDDVGFGLFEGIQQLQGLRECNSHTWRIIPGLVSR